MCIPNYYNNNAYSLHQYVVYLLVSPILESKTVYIKVLKINISEILKNAICMKYGTI